MTYIRNQGYKNRMLCCQNIAFTFILSSSKVGLLNHTLLYDEEIL